MKTLTLREYECVETDLLTPVMAERLRDHFSQYVKVERSWNGQGWQMRASHYIGTIVLDHLHITILPKTTVTNLFYMLTYAYRLPQFRTEETLATISDNIFEFIVRIFLEQTQQLIRQGIYRNYVEQEEVQIYLRGRLMLADYLRQNAVRVGYFVQRANEHTSNVPENQILKYTLWLLSQLDYRETAMTTRLRRAYAMLGEVSHVMVNATDCYQLQFTRLNERYRAPIHLAALLLRHLSLESGRGDERFFSYLFDMNEVFEKFVGYYLQERFRDHPTIDVLLQERIWLDAERQEHGIPDIIIQHNQAPLYVLDTKYKQFKGSPDPADRNQLWIYNQRLKPRAGILIYANEELPLYQTTFDEIPLYAKSLPLTGTLTEFQWGCRRFVEELINAMSERS